jgi:hypothetical protein
MSSDTLFSSVPPVARTVEAVVLAAALKSARRLGPDLGLIGEAQSDGHISSSR